MFRNSIGGIHSTFLGAKNKIWFIKHTLEGKAVCLFKPENMFRRLVGKCVHFIYFDSMILIIIFISTVALTLDNPLNDPDGD